MDLDMQRMLDINNTLKEENQLLQKEITHSCERGDIYTTERCQELEQMNQALQDQVASLNAQLTRLSETKRESDSMLADWKREKEEMEIEMITIKNQMQELVNENEEDKKRLDFLYEECKALSSKLDTTMETMEQYKIAYKNVKKRNESNERMKVVVNEAGGLTSSSLSYHLILGLKKDISPEREMAMLKDDIMESSAYNIMVLQISGAPLTATMVDSLFQPIEEGVLPSIRIVDLYGCSLENEAIGALSRWLDKFLFIDVLSPAIIGTSCKSVTNRT